MRQHRSLLADESAAGAAEFALVLPFLLLFLLGLVDSGRFIWESNRAEKATQMGVRYAVATGPVLSGLDTFSFATQGGVVAGTSVPPVQFERAECDSDGCDCVPSGAAFCAAAGHDATAFNNIVERMRDMYPQIAANNVVVEYQNVGLGYSGDPNGPDVAPLVTVRLTGMTFQPLSTLIFGAAVGMPDFRAALTLEDGSGTWSN